MKKIAVFAAAAAIIVNISLAPTRVAAQMPAGVVRGATVEGITEYTLGNGLRVLLFPDQTKQTITVNMTYLVGSRHENYGETGMAHLLEHMLFKGTPHHPNVPAELTTHGTRPNGSTWYDRTNYFETFAATDENLNWALDLEADRMINSYVARKDLDSEFTVVRNEMEMGENDPFNILFEKTSAIAYDWHNYGKDTIGARSDVENVPIDRLQAFYHKYYQPDNAVLLVAGKFDDAKTLGLIDKYFASIPKPARTLPPNYTIEPTQDGERQVTVRRVGDAQFLMAGYHVPSAAHADGPALDILAFLLSDTPSGRLYKSLVESKKAVNVFNFAPPMKEPSFIVLGAELRKDMALDAARDTLLQTVETAATTEPTKDEVDRARAALLKQIELSINDANRVGLEMSEWIARGDWRLFFIYRDRIRNVTPADVKRVAAAYLKPSNRTLGMFVPTEKPDRAAVPNVSDNDITALVKDYKGDAAVAQGEAFDPSPANVESRIRRSKVGGLDVAFLTKENRGDSVVANLTLRLGSESALMNRAAVGQLTARMLERGTRKHTRQQLSDEFDRLKAQVNVFGNATGVNVSIETTRQNLGAVLGLVGEMLKEPSFPQSEFDQLRSEAVTQLDSQRSEPTFVAITELSRHFNIYPKGHVLYAGTADEQIADLNAVALGDVEKFYRDFYGASSGQITVVGDFDDKEIGSVLSNTFAGWKSSTPFQRIKAEYRAIDPKDVSLETPDKANAFLMARLNVKMRDDNADYPAFVLANYMLGGGFLSSRLAARIRQKEGLSYGVGSGFGASALDETGQFTANAIFAPENGEKLEAAFRDEVEKAVNSGFTADEIEAAKKGWLQSRQVSRAQDRELSSRINTYLFYGRTIAWDADLESKIRALTPDQINAAFRKYMTPANITIVKAGDFARVKAGH